MSHPVHYSSELSYRWNEEKREQKPLDAYVQSEFRRGGGVKEEEKGEVRREIGQKFDSSESSARCFFSADEVSNVRCHEEDMSGM